MPLRSCSKWVWKVHRGKGKARGTLAVFWCWGWGTDVSEFGGLRLVSEGALEPSHRQPSRHMEGWASAQQAEGAAAA